MLLGAIIGSIIKNIPLAIIFAFLGHYLLDFFPHIEYPIKNIEKKQWQRSIPDFLKVTIDLCLGVALIFLLSNNSFSIYICAFFAILPDGLTLLSKIFSNNLLEWHTYFHHEKIHILKNKKISDFWRFLIQTVIIIILIFLL
jgi:hypothetical protein